MPNNCSQCQYLTRLFDGHICNAFHDITDLSEESLKEENTCPDFKELDRGGIRSLSRDLLRDIGFCEQDIETTRLEINRLEIPDIRLYSPHTLSFSQIGAFLGWVRLTFQGNTLYILREHSSYTTEAIALIRDNLILFQENREWFDHRGMEISRVW